MSAYGLALATHSVLRWALLALGSAVLVTSLLRSRQQWTPSSERLSVLFVAVADTQLLLGLVLYLWLSPIAPLAFSGGLSALRSNAAVLFFGALHPLAMLASVVVVHVGRVRCRREKSDALKHRTMAITAALWLALVLAAIPWPWLSYGRPLAPRML